MHVLLLRNRSFLIVSQYLDSFQVLHERKSMFLWLLNIGIVGRD